MTDNIRTKKAGWKHKNFDPRKWEDTASKLIAKADEMKEALEAKSKQDSAEISTDET